MSNFTIRPIHSADDAAMAAIIRSVMPEFGAIGSGFASASALRHAIQSGNQITAQAKLAMTDSTYTLCQKLIQEGRGPLTLNHLENIILAKLRTTNLKELRKLPDISEGLEYKIISSSLNSVCLILFPDMTGLRREDIFSCFFRCITGIMCSAIS